MLVLHEGPHNLCGEAPLINGHRSMDADREAEVDDSGQLEGGTGLFMRVSAPSVEGQAPLWLWKEGRQVHCSSPLPLPGGVLAQEVGMGKTVETVALVALGGEVQSAPSENRASLHHPRSWRMLHDAPHHLMCP